MLAQLEQENKALQAEVARLRKEVDAVAKNKAAFCSTLAAGFRNLVAASKEYELS